MASSKNPTTFGQLVIGPPGSGKTTYCQAMSTFLGSIGRKVVVVNVDPANDDLCYKAAIDVSELITVEDAMQHMHLGPNGGLVYSMEYLLENIDWFLDKLGKYRDCYVLFDFPGQVELYTHHESIRNLVSHLESSGFRLCAVHLVDSHYCSDPGNFFAQGKQSEGLKGKFISTLLLSLTAMLHLGLPHVNLLSKIDVLHQFKDRLLFGIDFYTDVLDLQYLLEALDEDPFSKKYRKLNAAIVSLVEDFSLVTFLPLNTKDQKSLLRVRSAVDKASGWVYGQGEERSVQQLLACAVGAETEQERIGDLKDSLMDTDDPDNL
ncbi:GPN-loop GTPase 2 [Frankliniella fusca]|uniref:GPN-loop GTPase 2 n=1 Tax=Frankliniella fusca TaxID=407009 RepID=A0AAE1HA66_9NEOP|nr:GPN-loop GTPase 2 [Frankliniella fusca]